MDGLLTAGALVLDPTGANLYVASERTFFSDDWLAVFSRSSTTGELTFLQGFQSSALEVPAGCAGTDSTNSAVAVSPDGLFVAVSAPFRGALATFGRAADGTLTLLAAICDRLSDPSDDIGAIIDLAPSPDGKHLYTAGGAFGTLSTIDYKCTSANVNLVLANASVATPQTRKACHSVTMGPAYHVLSAGSLTVTSPVIRVGNEVSFAGVVTLVSAVP